MNVLWENINRKFALRLVLSTAFFGLLSVYFYLSEVEKERVNYERQSLFHLTLLQQSLEKRLKSSISDLMVLSQDRALATIESEPTPEARQHLEQAFVIFARNKQYYDQLRFLDENGMEIIRINADSGTPYVVPEAKLQDKSDRYYFTDTISLNEGEVFISPLELNIENGKIERPFKPVIRLATPVVYGQEKRRGIIVLNYMGSMLTQDFKDVTAAIENDVLLVAADGFCKYHSRTLDWEWDSQLGHGHSFKRQYPEAWQRISNADEGHFYGDHGLFTFTTIDPATLTSGTTTTIGRGYSEDNSGGNHWKALYHISKQDLDAITFAVVVKMLPFFIPLFLFLIVINWWLSLAQIRRIKAEELLLKRFLQQTRVAELEQYALTAGDPAAMMDVIVDAIPDVLGVDYCAILELQDDGEALLLSAGSGWQQGLVGRETVGSGIESPAGYTLAHKEPLIIEDLHNERRFTGDQLLHDHGVFSGMNVIIEGDSRPFGILGIYTSKQHTFTQSDLFFVKEVANILSVMIAIKSSQAQISLQSSALAAAADGIVITDREGVIQWANQAYTKLTGYEFDEMRGKTPRILKSGKHDLAFYKNLWDTILSGDVWKSELYNRRKDGSLYLEEETITPVFGPSGDISHFIAIKRDISQQHKLQKQLQQAQKMESIGQLTGGIAHDFNNILASILGFTELALQRFVRDDQPELREYLNEVAHAGKRARDLVSQMLAFGRMDSGKTSLLQIPPMIKEVTKLLQATLPSTIQISSHADADLPKVMIDPVQLHQILMNMSINARDAIGDKGRIDIRVNREQVTNRDEHTVQTALNGELLSNICDACHHEIEAGDYVVLSVQDSGSGMSDDTLSRIFEPFYTTKEVGKGSGMGLSMVHGIVHQHGGHILVDTQIGIGTTFRLLFPVGENDAVHEPEAELSISPITEGLNGARILIVDDEEAIARFMEELFEDRGGKVTVMTDSQAALALFKQEPTAFDLIITDQTMPQLTGVELAQKILAVRPELPIILSTGYSDQVDEVKAKTLGIRGYITKPVEVDTLFNMVQSLIV